MPRGDKTGPDCKGPGTGRGLGGCVVPEALNAAITPERGRGYGRGRGRGRGYNRRYRRD